MTDDNPIKRWTAKRKATVIMDIFKGKTAVAEVARQHDLTLFEIVCGTCVKIFSINSAKL